MTGLTTARLKAYAGFVKLEHTLFSLPLIYAGMWLHTRGWPPARLAVLILLAAAGARVLAMGLNRIIDAEIDRRNPRTRNRELARRAMTAAEAWAIISAAGAVYVASAAAISPVCLRWSPLPVALFVGYPYLKRFTSLAHLGLGLAWSMAPVGGWLAASGSLALFYEVAWLWLFSVLWVTGFDIIYATMDEAFDREWGLHSMPAAIGRRKALQTSSMLHAFAFLALYLLWSGPLGRSQASGLVLLAIFGLLVWQHAVAARKPQLAFFELNAILGFLVLVFIAAGT